MFACLVYASKYILYASIRQINKSESFTRTSLKTSAPQFQSMTVSGIWMMFCVIMVFSALAEYGIILFLKLRENMHLVNIRPPLSITDRNIKFDESTLSNNSIGGKCASQTISHILEDNQEDKKVLQIAKNVTTKKDNAKYGEYRRLDLFSLILFPSVFFCFVTTYFVVFCYYLY